MKRLFLTTAVIALIIAPSAEAATKECAVTRKSDFETTYKPAQLRTGKFTVRIVTAGNSVVIERCSFAKSVGRVTCDAYKPDRIEFDQNIQATKYYFFASQFDVQVFKDGSFVENNGRGGVAFGWCR